MSNLYALYLSVGAKANVEAGLTAGVWGLTDDAVRRRLEVEALGETPTGLELIQDLQIGDIILAGSGGPQPRVPRGGWDGESLREVLTWRVTRPYFHETSQVWPTLKRRPEEVFPHRFGIEQVAQDAEVTAAEINRLTMRQFHYSANIGGLPVPVSFDIPLVEAVEALAGDETEDPAILLLDGNLDSVTISAFRREQRKLRSAIFAGGPSGTCDLCGRSYPISCLRAAHVKRRSVCSDPERRDLANVMKACTLGCDHLFELGLIRVGTDGKIIADGEGTTGDLREHLQGLSGRICTAYDQASARYFAWHAENAAP